MTNRWSRPSPIACNHPALAWQGSSLRIAHPTGLAGIILSRRCSAISKTLAIDVRSWPKADIGPRPTAGKDGNVSYRTIADIDAAAEL